MCVHMFSLNARDFHYACVVLIVIDFDARNSSRCNFMFPSFTDSIQIA